MTSPFHGTRPAMPVRRAVGARRRLPHSRTPNHQPPTWEAPRRADGLWVHRLSTLAVVACVLCLVASGCFSPHTVATRHFVLSAVPPATDATSTPRLGVRVLGMPDYLLGSSLAVRQSATEIRYLETALWAERLDKGFERALAADLAAAIPTDQVRLGAWRADDVTVEAHIRVEQFDVDKDGKGTLVAWWRITSPGGAKALKSGETRLSKTGRSPAGDAQNIVTTLSELTAEFSRELAQHIKEIAPQ